MKQALSDQFDDALIWTSSGCAEWPRARSPLGYGRVRVDGRTRQAHRVAWERARGPIPHGLEVCHSCDNPPCCNVTHLFLGTHAENMADCKRKGRSGSGIVRGSSHGASKLTEDDVRWIRAAVAAGGRQADLARRFAVTPTSISFIIKRKTWRHI